MICLMQISLSSLNNPSKASWWELWWW